jgi:hypothetical protein
MDLLRMESSTEGAVERSISAGEMKPRVLIACSVFEQEVRAVLDPDLEVEIVWIEAALHAVPEKLEETLLGILSDENTQKKDIRVLLGIGCHPDVAHHAKHFGARLSPVKNCIEAFCGDQARELEANRTMVMAPGWVRAWPRIMDALGWNEVDVRINLGRYDRILLLEPGIEPLSEEEILEFFDLTQVPMDVQPLSLDHFRNVLREVLS